MIIALKCSRGAIGVVPCVSYTMMAKFASENTADICSKAAALPLTICYAKHDHSGWEEPKSASYLFRTVWQENGTEIERAAEERVHIHGSQS
jgi:hypothetical protein